jgi:signal transduction histidine kinase
VFRVAQEALTNTLKHAGRPASARLSLRIAGGRVELVVTDTGMATGSPPPVAAGAAAPDAATALGAVDGRGLRGMRERAAAYGGTLAAGPQPGGGWRVALQLATDVEAAIG